MSPSASTTVKPKETKENKIHFSYRFTYKSSSFCKWQIHPLLANRRRNMQEESVVLNRPITITWACRGHRQLHFERCACQVALWSFGEVCGSGVVATVTVQNANVTEEMRVTYVKVYLQCLYHSLREQRGCYAFYCPW